MIIRPMVACCCLLAICFSASGQGIEWHRSFADAQAQAKEEGKPMMVVYTGLGWCYACELLDREVFKQVMFQDAVSDLFVFVELTSESGNDPESQAREKERTKFGEDYHCRLVPSTVLMDPKGKPFAIFSGYESRKGLTGYLKQLSSALAARDERDSLMNKAQSSAGMERAQYLDAALTCVDSKLGTIRDHQDDPLLFFYADTVREILTLTQSRGLIAQKYIERQESRHAWQMEQMVFEPLDDFTKKNDYRGAIDYIDQRLDSSLGKELKSRLRRMRLNCLESSQRYEEALEYCRTMLSDRELTEPQRDRYLEREISLVYLRLRQREEGLRLIDMRIAEAGEDNKRRAKFLSQKSQLLYRRGPVDQSIEAFRQYRELTESQSDEWYEATALLARELCRAGQYDEALQLVEVYLAHDRVPWVLIDGAEICIAMQDYERARVYLEDMQTEVNKLSISERGSERGDSTALQKRIDDAVASLLKRDK